jgi:Berberine and berberine like
MLLEFFAATQPFSSGEAYVSSMDGDEPGGNKQAYGPK